MKGDALMRRVQTRLMETVRSGETVCIALSGGADSVCLLRCLSDLKQTCGIFVTAVHVNHHLRGAESDRDQQFCQTLCGELDVPLKIISVDVESLAKTQKISIELAARRCRYAAFETIAADWIATAHTASDNAETLIHRLVRGASLHGLTSIPPVNGRYLRPMLDVTRAEVEAYLEAYSQSYVTDSTNLTDQYTRNRIRHQIMPALETLNPSFVRTASHTIRSLSREDDYLSKQAVAAYAACFDGSHMLTGIAALHPAIRIRCLAKLLEHHELSYDAPLLERLEQLCQHGGRWEIAGNVYAVAKPGMLWIEIIPEPQQTPQPVPLQIGKTRLYPGFFCRAQRMDAAAWKKARIVHKNFANYYLDYDRIKGDLFLSPRFPGARMRLSGRNFTTLLKKSIQANVPKERRDTLHLLCDAEGIVWAEFIGIADRVAPRADTAHILCISVQAEEIG